MKNKPRGFTLIEIMIVLTVVFVILAIATPSFIRSRLIASESAALANCRTINNASDLFHINHDTFPADLSEFIEPVSNPPYIDSELASGQKQGYRFTYTRVNQDHYTLNASSLSVGLLRGRYFYTDETGVIHYNATRAARVTDPILY